MGLFSRLSPWAQPPEAGGDGGSRFAYARGYQDGMTAAYQKLADAIVRAANASPLPEDHPSRQAALGLARDCQRAAADIGGEPL